jgi:hypothetical protein
VSQFEIGGCHGVASGFPFFAGWSPILTSCTMPGADVPGFASANRLIGLSTFQHSEIALQQVRGIKAGMCVKSAIHMWLHLDKHGHCFIAAIWHIEPLQNRPRDGFWHDRPPELRHATTEQKSIRNAPWDQKAENAAPT